MLLTGLLVALLSLAGPGTAAAGIPSDPCCACDCSGTIVACANTQGSCLALNGTCAGLGLNGSCDFGFVNSSLPCAETSECAGLLRSEAAPVVGPTGLAVATAALGVLAWLRVRQRQGR
jgi:hypothetical protein